MMTSETQPIPFFKRAWVQNGLWIIGALAIYLIMRPIMQGDVVRGQVPALQLTSLTGQAFDLSQIKQPTLIHIWAEWCPICEITRDSVESIAKSHPVISIATQSGSDAEVLAYAQQHQMNPQHIINDPNGKLMQAFGTKGVPADFIVDSQGKIQFVEVGFTSGIGLRLRLWWLGLQD
ncbi:redoxin family protein [Thiosulfativibrio zosterae]|uniref:Thioredoxin domain-containing protein n=1 Tax=Thiosulfativibrio zosterae TaxID=2675053 RepID=A0A6F8PQ37_9GAMM|nr:redoxin family protein [Thiosulfativibrio zosterae]BBP44147.1 hypothetical protein THMIRHAT_18930 [Thiosulfativibrio zosterae]